MLMLWFLIFYSVFTFLDIFLHFFSFCFTVSSVTDFKTFQVELGVSFFKFYIFSCLVHTFHVLLWKFYSGFLQLDVVPLGSLQYGCVLPLTLV